MFPAIFLLFLFMEVESTFPYPPFNGINPHPRLENILDSSDVQNRRALQTNEIVGCELEDILNMVGLEELQLIIEALASRKGVSPYLVLRKLNRRMRNKEDIEEAMMNAIDGPPLPELLHPPLVEFPPAIPVAPETSRVPYALSPDVAISENGDDGTKVVIIPVAQSPPNRSPNMVKTEHKLRKESSFSSNSVKPLVGRISNMLPEVFFSPMKNNQLKPPLGATIRINTGDPLSPITRDIVVTVSPLMTLIEALRQAELKYQNVLGLSHDSEIITFAHSSSVDCYIVNSIDDVVNNEDSGWKVTVTDRDGQVVYDSFCLPSGKDTLVKPGTVISLTYVPL